MNLTSICAVQSFIKFIVNEKTRKLFVLPEKFLLTCTYFGCIIRFIILIERKVNFMYITIISQKVSFRNSEQYILRRTGSLPAET